MIDQDSRFRAISGSELDQVALVLPDEDSPLDDKLRVRGVDNLRVADASALPRIPRANTSAPSIMLGERCADFLLAQHS